MAGVRSGPPQFVPVIGKIGEEQRQGQAGPDHHFGNGMKILDIDAERRRDESCRHVSAPHDAMQSGEARAQPVRKLHRRQQRRARARQRVRQQSPLERLIVFPLWIRGVDQKALVVKDDVEHQCADHSESGIFSPQRRTRQRYARPGISRMADDDRADYTPATAAQQRGAAGVQPSGDRMGSEGIAPGLLCRVSNLQEQHHGKHHPIFSVSRTGTIFPVSRTG